MTLDEAAEQLYAVFATYLLRDRIPGCTHCVDAAMEAPSPERLQGVEGSKFLIGLYRWSDLGRR